MDKAKIGIILGSASDLPHARKIGDVLNELDVAFEVTIASAHRTPDDAANYAKNARNRGLETIIAVAGLSAALPGAIAAQTTLPVIGVPVESGSLLGMDALLSTAARSSRRLRWHQRKRQCRPAGREDCCFPRRPARRPSAAVRRQKGKIGPCRQDRRKVLRRSADGPRRSAGMRICLEFCRC